MLRDKDTEADFQRFLRRVDDVTNLLQGLKSPDSAVQEKAIAETEKRLREQGASREEDEEEEECRTTVNRTLINTSVRAFPSEIKAGLNGFLAALEKDAKERAQRRRRNEQLANALKEQGNEAFRAGDFALAIQRYSEGLEKLRDKQELYTNRAQVCGRAGATSGWVLWGWARVKDPKRCSVTRLGCGEPLLLHSQWGKSSQFPA
uniref:Uncharacterized protein n=1 Tax=Geospiza parvula TaxID=87175 RepID=A0A8C3NG45_GEOPR